MVETDLLDTIEQLIELLKKNSYSTKNMNTDIVCFQKEDMHNNNMNNAHPTILKFVCPVYCEDPDEYINTAHLNDFLNNRNKIMQDIQKKSRG